MSRKNMNNLCAPKVTTIPTASVRMNLRVISAVTSKDSFVKVGLGPHPVARGVLAFRVADIF